MNSADSLTVVPDTLTAGYVPTSGARVRWYRKPGPGPTLVLLHGGGAHAAWWFDSVEHFGDHDVVLLDLSGHGDSGRRDVYTLDAWANEVREALAALGVEEAVIVCHSMSGRIGVLLAAAGTPLVRALVLVDTVIPTHAGEGMPAPVPLRAYASRAEAVDRFRFIPPAPEISDETRLWVGERSVRETPEGWTWKFDPQIFASQDAASVNAAIPDIQCPVGLIVASESTVSRVEMAEEIARLTGNDVHVRVIDGVGHHLTLEKPETVASMIIGVVSHLVQE